MGSGAAGAVYRRGDALVCCARCGASVQAPAPLLWGPLAQAGWRWQGVRQRLPKFAADEWLVFCPGCPPVTGPKSEDLLGSRREESTMPRRNDLRAAEVVRQYRTGETMQALAAQYKASVDAIRLRCPVVMRTGAFEELSDEDLRGLVEQGWTAREIAYAYAVPAKGVAQRMKDLPDPEPAG